MMSIPTSSQENIAVEISKQVHSTYIHYRSDQLGSLWHMAQIRAIEKEFLLQIIILLTHSTNIQGSYYEPGTHKTYPTQWCAINVFRDSK